jgi:hypothetical protein
VRDVSIVTIPAHLDNVSVHLTCMHKYVYICICVYVRAYTYVLTVVVTANVFFYSLMKPFLLSAFGEASFSHDAGQLRRLLKLVGQLAVEKDGQEKRNSTELIVCFLPLVTSPMWDQFLTCLDMLRDLEPSVVEVEKAASKTKQPSVSSILPLTMKLSSLIECFFVAASIGPLLGKSFSNAFLTSLVLRQSKGLASGQGGVAAAAAPVTPFRSNIGRPAPVFTPIVPPAVAPVR